MRVFRQAGALLGGGALALITLALLFQAPANQAAEPRAPVVRRVAVSVAEARSGDMDQLITALGTVTPRATVTVRSRVAGPIVKLHFREGQQVEKGAMLAEIDPRPFEVALAQARGDLARDRALLDNARRDLARYRELLAQDSIAPQQVDAQTALLAQYEGTVAADQAAVDQAALNLEFARITAPIAGRVGLRQVDAGNLVAANDAQGLVTITATRPITVVFAVPADKLPAIRARLAAGARLAVEVFDRDGRALLARGELVSLDNQIDVATATLRLRAEFANDDEALFPNQFVNVALHVDTLSDVVLIPTAAVQRGQDGAFVYVVDAERIARLRQITLGAGGGDEVVALSGVASGEIVVVEGVDKLHDGSPVEPARAPPARPLAEDTRARP
ncbi:MAG: MdtA/MuxA family multidrug efflux RND transporter periplasmic adaptor subunit [Gammaproteobacteria bacterium]